MRQFDIKKAASGESICTRTGHDVTYICDRNGLVLVDFYEHGKHMYVSAFSDDGRIRKDSESDYDLFMKEK